MYFNQWTNVRVSINTLSLRQNRQHFPDDIFNCIFLNENVWKITDIYASLSLNELTNVSASNRYANFVSTGGYASKDEV